MILCLTKNVQELIHKDNLENITEVNSQMWYVNVENYGRKKLFFFVHAQTGYTLVFYGLKIKQFDKLDSYFNDALREVLSYDCFIEEAIEAFIRDLGTIVYSKTNNRTVISNSVQKMNMANSYLDLINKDICFQKIVSHRVNQLFSAKMKTPRENLHEYLLKFSPVTTSHVGYELDVTLDLEKDSVLRRVVVPNYYTLDDLHIVIQKLFGWKNMHLHQFVNKRTKQSYSSMKNIDDMFNPLDSKVVSLDDAFGAFDEWDYLYDFGDGWTHHLFCRMIIHQPEPIITYCTYYQGKNVPENVGGIFGHHRFKEIMMNPNHKEYKQYHDWLISTQYEKFDIDLVNRSLANEFPLGFYFTIQNDKRNRLGYKIY